ncbi:MAG: tetratricopeptide repeat protein, partial [Planctomycetes bacterium]|nr:tetratricopeptide repeat protein [Planctomycetota bacterium]
ELAQSGVRLDELASGLERVRAVLPDLERPLAQLEILSRGKRIVIRNELGLIEPESGQRVFDFDPPEVRESDVDTIPFRSLDLSPPTFFSASHPQPHDHRHAWSATKWFQEGCRLSEENEVEAAIEAFRLALIDDPSNPAYHFHLADVLYREGCVPGAIERYYMTVELDHDFLEAWNQLGCLLAETGRVTSAIEAFQVALDLHSDFPDAHFHIAELLERSGKRADAIEHWRHYLRYDQRGPWADIARQKLGEDNEYS